nr:putative inorganic phosphate cotransporter isoform X1 [Onthophagus taurus]
MEKESQRNTADVAQEIENKASLPWYGVRHTQMILLFVLIIIGYGMRVNLSVGIVAMTDTDTISDIPTYNWTIKSTILSSFFWGYIIPQVGVGQLAERFGAKWFLTGSMAVSALFTLLIPPMAELGSWGVMICRVIQGFTQGFFYPCMHNLLSKWIPLNERSRLGTFVYAGGPLGTVISMPVTGWISASSAGWPTAFYLYGALGFAWCIIWLIYGSNGPTDHKTISAQEKDYILKSCGQSDKNKHVTPWKDLIKSLPVWAILITHCGQNWGFWTLLTEIPIYMKGVLNFNISKNGLLSAAPYFALWVLSFLFGFLTDYTINKGIFSVGVARKVVTAIGLIGPAGALFALGMAESDQKGLVIGLLITAVGLNSAIFCGYQVSHVDIAPTHAGTLMGITNGGANIFSIIAPLIVELVVTDESDTDQWKIVFFTAATIYVVADIIYTIFGSGERQYWDQENVSDEKECEKLFESDKKEDEISKLLEIYNQKRSYTHFISR